MPNRKGILFFAVSEIIIGGLSLILTSLPLLTGTSAKPWNVLVFILITSSISLALGLGLLFKFKYARKFLLFFSGWVILSKILVLAGLITLNGALETTIAPNVKNIISIIYHGSLIVYFLCPSVKNEFSL